MLCTDFPVDDGPGSSYASALASHTFQEVLRNLAFLESIQHLAAGGDAVGLTCMDGNGAVGAKAGHRAFEGLADAAGTGVNTARFGGMFLFVLRETVGIESHQI